MIQDSNRIAIIAGEREVTFSELLERINLYARQFCCAPGERTLIFADNSEGWVYAFYSVWTGGGIPVPVDASGAISDVAYIIRDCKPAGIWTSAKRLPVVQAALEEAGHKAEIRLVEDYETMPTDGWKASLTYREEDTAVIIYTSGTTGSPKGVMLSFRNILVNIDAVYRKVPIFNTERRTLTLLPLHHVLPLVGTLIMPLYCGGGIAICPTISGPDIMATLKRGRVAIMVGVPRLWQMLYGGIKKKIDERWITRMLFCLCAKVNSRRLSRLIFKAVHEKLGGNILYLVSGGAALDREIAIGLQTLGLQLLEGYGMTEAAPLIAFTRPGDLVPGSVGLPIDGMECRIIDGEICAKGPNIMQGYYNRPEETAAVIDKDGFLHSGDLGRTDNKGRIYITGRSKEIIVLSNGKNVQPAEIEYKLEKYTERVKEAAVVQDGDQLRAIIVPEEEWASGLTDKQVEEALKREVLEPYNLTVTNYKKLMNLLVYRDQLPRTRIGKLQRFKLNDILRGVKAPEPRNSVNPNLRESEFPELRIIRDYLEREKLIQVKPTDHIETDLALDSLDMVSLEGFILQTFGTKVNAASMPGFRNIEAMARYVAESKTRMEIEEEDWHAFLSSDATALDLPKTSFILPLMRNASKLMLKLYNRLEIVGTENIPSDGPCILAPNHQSFLDGAVVAAGLPAEVLRRTYSYATEEHIQSRLRKAVARNSNVILMERGNLRDSILRMAKVLRQGSNLLIFPEGRRTDTGALGTFRKTFAILATELQVPIVPVRITGAFEALPRTASIIKPHSIKVEFLPAVTPDRNDTYEACAEKVKQIIQPGSQTNSRLRSKPTQ